MLAFGFTKKCLFCFRFYRKTSSLNETRRKYVFHPREGHILARLDITELYTIFDVLKNIEFWLKTTRS
jgi:hypothetical protein